MSDAVVSQTSQAPPACLVLLSSGTEFEPAQVGRRFVLSPEGTVVGNQPVAEIPLASSPQVPRSVRFYYDDDRLWHLENHHVARESRVLINSMISHECTVSNGDLVQIGDAVLKFLEGEQATSDLHEALFQRIEQERKRAETDALTNSSNRLVLERCLDLEVQRSKLYNHPLSVIVLDIDYFRNINHEFGHPGGDLALTRLAAAIQEHTRSMDTFARWGGEEFVILLPMTSTEQAMTFAERIRTIVENLAIPFEHRTIRFTASLGVATLRPDGSPASLLAEADALLFQAKDAGRNRVVGPTNPIETPNHHAPN